MERYLLAHDLGTSGNKATLYHTDGRLAASVVASYPTQYPHPGWVEQDPEDWWKAVCETSCSLLQKAAVAPEQVAVVSFSAQMMGCLLVDKEGNPLRPMITWADTRASQEEQELRQAMDETDFYCLTGHRPSASYSAAKLMWVRRHEPEVYRKAYKMLHAKDFIIHRLTGAFVSDYSDASGTNLFDINRKCWSETLCTTLDIPMELLPELHSSATVVGGVTKEAAACCGLVPGTPVVLGGGDGSCACVGAGVVRQGNTYCVLGSSSWISTASTKPVFDPQKRTFNWVHLDSALYTPCGTMQAAGVSYAWFRDTLCTAEQQQAAQNGTNIYKLLDEAASKTAPGANGLLFLPYLLGERSPRWNHKARGAFLGLDVTTTKPQMARAVLEGVGYNLKIILDALDAFSPIGALTMIGGGAKGALWLQILADIWQRLLQLPAYREEATSLGAAICGGVGVGIYSDYRVVEQLNPIQRTVAPNPENADRYQELLKLFDASYKALLPVYDALDAYRKEMRL